MRRQPSWGVLNAAKLSLKKSRLQNFSAFAQTFFKPNGMDFEI